MRALRRLIAASVLAGLVLSSSHACAQGRADLEKARAAYLARNYAEAEARLEVLVDPKDGVKERALLSEARMYLGAVLLAQGRQKQAEDVFEKLILNDVTYDPDPLSFPGDVINTFIDTRAQLQERIKTAAQTAAKLEAERRAREEAERRQQEEWLEKVKAQAAEEKVTIKNDRLVAFLPFGAGQFQNRQPVLGWIFLGTQAALVVASAVTLPMYLYARGRADDEARSGDIERKADAYQERAEDIRFTNIGLAGAFVAVAAIGIIQANLGYVPEIVEVKKRELPALPALSRLSPVISPVARGDGAPTGVFVGLSGVVF
jgi:tetratricopeptide (TPR) repeat protein